jgi:plastocyanin
MRILAFLCAFMFATTSAAADVFVSVRAGGLPVANAVVTLYPASGAAALADARFNWPMQMVQQHLQFSPFVLVVPQGATVAFPNLDTVRHHVYSFSPAHRFELRLYGRDETRTVRFDLPGVIALGCNIHDQMIAFIKVVDTPYAAKTDADGDVVLHDAPPGAAMMKVWHPYLKAPNNEVTRGIEVARAGQDHEDVAVDMRALPPRVGGY